MTIAPSMLTADEPASEAVGQLDAAQWAAGLELTEPYRSQLAKAMPRREDQLKRLRTPPLAATQPPAQIFVPLDTKPSIPVVDRRLPKAPPAQSPLENLDDQSLAAASIAQLGAALRQGKVTAVQLADLALKRLQQFDPLLTCVVTLTPELARSQAEQADRELQAGIDRGPLHGIPWGAKDLIAIPGYPTTWGAPQFREQSFEEEAVVAARLREAGAVLVAKLSLGALAMGDLWFGGMTRNPWKPSQGSSGSSAGSAAAVAAALVPFAIGSETLGSIVSPSNRCKVVGFRPTFGRVARSGCMPLAWTMDKLGPITRHVADAALVFNAIHGADTNDPSSRSVAFSWPQAFEPQRHRVGYVPNDTLAADREELNLLRELGVELVEVRLPPVEEAWPLVNNLDCEAASVFESLVRSGDLEGLNQWPSMLLGGFFTPATDWLRADRLRRKLMLQMRDAMRELTELIDCDDLVITNLTGHPSIVVARPTTNGPAEAAPTTNVLTGRIDHDSDLLSLAAAFQQQGGGPPPVPPIELASRNLSEARGQPSDAANAPQNEASQ